jgi:alpha,alpha-trehalose phosphorylase
MPAGAEPDRAGTANYGRRMLKREIVPPPEHIYPPEEWRIVERRYPNKHRERAETMFALSNGYLGVRGTFPEGRPALEPGTFVNGFHETWPIQHAEEAYGLATTGQTIVNVPDATIIKLYVDDEPLFLPTARLREYERVLDMRAGTITREILWSTASGKHVRVRSNRLVSFEHRHVMAMSYEVTLLNHPAPVVISSQVLNRQDAGADDEGAPRQRRDPRVAKAFGRRVLNAQIAEHDDLRLLFGYQTTNSRMTLGVGVHHVVEVDDHHTTTTTVDHDRGKVVVSADVAVGATLRIVKFASYQTSRSVPCRELVDRCSRTLDRVVRDGFDALVEAQRCNLDRFWDRADVQVGSGVDAVRTQQAVRWNIFQLGQATWRAEGSGVPAKGLTGQAYEGHYFWDTEVYILPFLSYTQPRIARNLLRFRHGMLEQARQRARTLSQSGAMFPWRTINGEEASGAYQAGTAQYHLNADIAYAVRKYVDVRGDLGFMVEVGAELLIETARLWADLGFYGEDGRFYIHSVTGPDEYTTVVNDNAFTNLMARLNLHAAVATVRQLERKLPDEYRALALEVGLRSDELDEWQRAADSMFVPFDEHRGIHPQDAAFLDREVWDLAGTPRDKFPLLLHYHPLVIYRHQVLKQADVVLAMFLLGNEFTVEQKRRNFDYYDPLTTGDSSLSAAVQSIVAAEVGHDERALEYFRLALYMDLADIAGNVSDGIHVASAGGVWMTLVYGFGGVRDFDGELTIDPRLPTDWSSLGFSLRFRGRQLRVQLTQREERYLLEDGEPLTVTIRGEATELTPGSPLLLSPP